MSSKGAIGVFDSGLGGLTVAKEIMKLLPRESIVYFGDTGRVPYGTRSRETIRRYALEDERFLLSKNVKIIVAACGTVSSVAADTGESLPVPFVEVVTHSCYAAARATKNGKIGVLATSATVQSGAHREKLLSIMPDAKIIEQSGTLLVPLQLLHRGNVQKCLCDSWNHRCTDYCCWTNEFVWNSCACRDFPCVSGIDRRSFKRRGHGCGYG